MDAKRVILPVLVGLLAAFLTLEAEAGADLISAVARGDTATVQGLLAKGADANTSAANGSTALMLAASIGHEDILKALLAGGASVDSRAQNGVTALMLAAVKGHTGIVRALLTRRAEVNAKQERGWTALMFASEHGNTESALALLANGARVNANNKDKESALMLAASQGHTEIVQALLANGADPNADDSHGWSALVRATWEGHTGTKRALLTTSLLKPAAGSSDAGADEVLPAQHSAMNAKGARSGGAQPVVLRVTVTGKGGRLITNLSARSFEVYEDNGLQHLMRFEREEAPVSLGILVDHSRSMRYGLQKLADLNAAVAAFLKVANPEDEFFSMSFNTRLQLLTRFTRDRAEILRSLASTQLQGRTALRDGIYLAINRMRKAEHSKRALLVISDGDDTSSHYSEREVTRLVREADVQIYIIRILYRMYGRGSTRRAFEESSPPNLLSEVAERTGGRHFRIANINELPYVAAKIGVELRNQYALTYVPANQENKKWRRVEVKLMRIEGLPPMRAHVRRGYYTSHP